MPILELTNTALLAISTPLDEFNYYSELFLKKDENGEDFFKTIKAGRICDDCGRLPYDLMIKCDHVPDGAHWKSIHKKRRSVNFFCHHEKKTHTSATKKTQVGIPVRRR